MSAAPADLEARIRAYRAEQQARFDSHGLPRLGTTNRALAAWIDGAEYLTSPDPAPRTGSGDTTVAEAARLGKTQA